MKNKPTSICEFCKKETKDLFAHGSEGNFKYCCQECNPSQFRYRQHGNILERETLFIDKGV